MDGVLQVARSMGVIGRRWRGDCVEARERCRPFSMYDSRGKLDMSEGSGRPVEICMWQIAARYDWSPASARWATNRQTVHSVIGGGGPCPAEVHEPLLAGGVGFSCGLG